MIILSYSDLQFDNMNCTVYMYLSFTLTAQCCRNHVSTKQNKTIKER